MTRSSFAVVVCALIVGLAAAPLAMAQPAGGGQFRQLAPGVEITIQPDFDVRDTFSRHDVVELLADDPDYAERPGLPGIAPAKDVRFEHNVWGLEFTFKPIRFIEVDVPNFQGKARRKLIWYMVYHVKNKGEEPVRFIPQFVLHSHDTDKWYPARLIPAATGPIRRREDPNRPLKNIAEIVGEVPPSTDEVDNSVWGVVTWSDVDPRTDRFSIYVTGLTNAYRWVEEGEYSPDDPVGAHRRLERKTLQLNFWRAGDDLFESEREIRYGIPGEVDYQWVYR